MLHLGKLNERLYATVQCTVPSCHNQCADLKNPKHRISQRREGYGKDMQTLSQNSQPSKCFADYFHVSLLSTDALSIFQIKISAAG